MNTWIFSLSRGSSDLPKLEGKGAYIYTRFQNVYLSTYISKWKTYMQDNDHQYVKEKKNPTV